MENLETNVVASPGTLGSAKPGLAPLRLKKEHGSTGTLGKALEVLEVIASAPESLRFTDILTKVDQPRGTLHRQITNLIDEGLVLVNRDGSYSPGLRLLKLAANAWSKNSLRSIAEPHMRKLHEATGETVHLGIMSGLEVIYVDKIESQQSVRMHSQVGNASPLYCTGIGKAMMARLSAQDCSDRASKFRYHAYTPTTLASKKALLNEIDEIRRTGISHDREEHEPGITCVACGIGDGVETTIAGVSVTGPAFRVSNDERARWEKLVRETAQSIESELGIGLGPRHRE